MNEGVALTSHSFSLLDKYNDDIGHSRREYLTEDRSYHSYPRVFFYEVVSLTEKASVSDIQKEL
jgi:hypothetical protein